MVAVRKQSACSFHPPKDGDRAVFNFVNPNIKLAKGVQLTWSSQEDAK
jgi:hypothetical protein